MKRKHPIAATAPWRVEEVMGDLVPAAADVITIVGRSISLRDRQKAHELAIHVDRLQKLIGPLGTADRPEVIRPL